jgi:hypothetical protein
MFPVELGRFSLKSIFGGRIRVLRVTHFLGLWSMFLVSRSIPGTIRVPRVPHCLGLWSILDEYFLVYRGMFHVEQRRVYFPFRVLVGRYLNFLSGRRPFRCRPRSRGFCLLSFCANVPPKERPGVCLSENRLRPLNNGLRLFDVCLMDHVQYVSGETLLE